MTKKDELLGTAPMLPLIVKMALPAVMAQLVNLLYGIIDKIYIGHIPEVGDTALAGVGVTTSVILLVAAFASLVGGGGAPLAAIALGRGDRDEATKYLGNGFVMLLFFGVLCSVLGEVFAVPILNFGGASEVTMPYALEYVRIYLMGTVFVLIATGLNTFINCQGRPGVAMVSVLIGAVLNTALDPLFIFGFNMGIAGAAVATVISQAASATFVLAFLFSKRATLRLSLRSMRPELRIIGMTCALGISPFVMASTESLVGFTLNSQLRLYGGDLHVGALTVMQSAMQIVSVPLAGFTNGVTPVLSYNYGHGRRDRVVSAFKITLGIMFTVNLVGVLVMILFPRAIGGLFNNESPELLNLVAQYMPLFLAGMTIFGLQRACQNVFIGLGQAKISLFIALLRKVILLVPLAYILPTFMGVSGVYAAEAISDATAALICTAIFAVTFPRILSKMVKSDETSR